MIHESIRYNLPPHLMMASTHTHYSISAGGTGKKKEEGGQAS